MYEFKSPFSGYSIHRIFKFLSGNTPCSDDIPATLKWQGMSLVKPLLMRISLIICLVTFSLINVSAGSLHAQKISINKVNAPLYDIIDEIRNQTGYDFFMNMDLLKNAKPTTIQVKDASLEEVLNKCLQNQTLTYEIKDNKTVIIKEKDPGIVIKIKNFFDSPKTAGPQQMVVRGIVTDSAGRPMPGVSVAIKGNKSNVYTKENGSFEIPVTAKETILTFSYVGMEAQEKKVKDPSIPLRVIMRAHSQKLDDVVITGYSNIRKESFTGNSIKVNQAELLKVGNRNVIDILQVFDPSFRLEKNNIMGSDPNTMPEFYVRGRSGIGNKELDGQAGTGTGANLSKAALQNNPNLPIFIMDGYEIGVEKVYDYDMNRIKSITILKDAAATAIYGSRAANGVVVIETVPPKPGKVQITYNLVTSLTTPDLSDYNLMNAAEKLEAERLGGYYNTEGLPVSSAYVLTDEYIRKRSQVLRGVNTDWIAQPLANEFNQKHSIFIDGGSDQIRFGLNMKYDKQNGVMKGSSRDRKGAGLTLDYRLKNIQIRNDVSYDIVKAVVSPYGNFSDYTVKSPYDEMRSSSGEILRNTKSWHSGVTSSLNLVNPLYEVMMTNNSNKNGYQTLTDNLSVNWNIIPHLQLRGQLALSKTNNNSSEFIDPASGRYDIGVSTNYADIGQLTLGNSEQLNYNTNVFTNYVNSIKGHNINFSLGVNATEMQQNGNTSIYTGFPSGLQNSPNFASKVLSKPTYSDNHTRLFGAFMALNYSYKDIYLLDGSYRVDGSSQFGSEKKYAPFWSVGTGVNLHKYDFLKNNSVISRARVTGNIGQLGKTNFQPYAAIDTYGRSQDWYRTGPGVSLMYMGNTSLNWEKTNTYDLIFDLGLLQDRISFNVDLYNKVTRDLVNDVDLPLSAGFNVYKDNIGKIQNKGIELSFRAEVLRSKDLMVAVYGNFASNKNKLIDISKSLKKYNDLVNQQYQNYNIATATDPKNQAKYSTPHVKYVEGESITSVYGMKSLGINPADGKEIYLRKDGTITYDWNASDQVVIGDTSPKGQGSFGLNMTYKGFTLFGSFLYQFGGQQYNYTLLNKVENVDLYNKNADRRVLTQRWKNPGDVTMLKDIADSKWTTLPTSRFMQDYNAITLNSLSLGYNFSQNMLKKLHVSMLRMQLGTNNLFTISTVKQETGLSYPYARTFDFSLNLGL